MTAAFTKPPFICSNEGWGEFEISIDCYTTEKTKLSPIVHDLNFLETHYEATHTVVFKNPSQALQERLRETGPLPDDKKKAAGGRKSGVQKYDYEKIAEALEKLDEEDLLRVIQMINENKGPDTYIRSDVDGKSLTDAQTMRADDEDGKCCAYQYDVCLILIQVTRMASACAYCHSGLLDLIRMTPRTCKCSLAYVV